MGDARQVQQKQYELELKLLEEISKGFENGRTAAQIADLALAFRYVQGGTQPGSVVVNK